MIIWVLYDIKNNKARNNVGPSIETSRLIPVQYSVFLGTVTDNDKDSLQLQIEEVIDPEIDKVYIFPMNKNRIKTNRIAWTSL